MARRPITGLKASPGGGHGMVEATANRRRTQRLRPPSCFWRCGLRATISSALAWAGVIVIAAWADKNSAGIER
jgi:hypothetical protein